MKKTLQILKDAFMLFISAIIVIFDRLIMAFAIHKDVYGLKSLEDDDRKDAVSLRTAIYLIIATIGAAAYFIFFR